MWTLCSILTRQLQGLTSFFDKLIVQIKHAYIHRWFNYFYFRIYNSLPCPDLNPNLPGSNPPANHWAMTTRQKFVVRYSKDILFHLNKCLKIFYLQKNISRYCSKPWMGLYVLKGCAPQTSNDQGCMVNLLYSYKGLD